jgi:hypothetical protein
VILWRKKNAEEAGFAQIAARARSHGDPRA